MGLIILASIVTTVVTIAAILVKKFNRGDGYTKFVDGKYIVMPRSYPDIMEAAGYGLRWGIGAIATSAMILILVLLAILPYSASKVTQLTLFYDYNKIEYEAAIQSVKMRMEGGRDSGLFDAVNLQQIEGYQVAVMDARDAFVEYNKNLRHNRYWGRDFWVGMFWIDAPDRLEYLSIEGLR